jgi:hypothetical protein
VGLLGDHAWDVCDTQHVCARVVLWLHWLCHSWCAAHRRRHRWACWGIMLLTFVTHSMYVPGWFCGCTGCVIHSVRHTAGGTGGWAVDLSYTVSTRHIKYGSDTSACI